MDHRKFFTQISFVSLGIIILIFLLNLGPAFQIYQVLSWVSFIFFLSLSILMYFIGHYAAHSSNKNTFLQIVMASTFLKMFLCVGIVVVYSSIVKPETTLFVVPFLLVYIIFTIFETYVMMKLSYINPSKESKNE